MEKRLFVQLNGNRKVLGILRGYDVREKQKASPPLHFCIQPSKPSHPARADAKPPNQVFLNIVLDEAVEEKAGGEKVRLGMVVIRGNSVVMLEVSGAISITQLVLRRGVRSRLFC
jgi:small nuclear ribonucleoprotein G